MRWSPEQLESIKCDLCGNHITRTVIERRDNMRAVECSNCGLCFINPRPSKEIVADIYNNNYFSKINNKTDVNNFGYFNYTNKLNIFELRRAAKNRLSIYKRYSDLRNKFCLEIGCATGEFCNYLEMNGAITTGIDLSYEAIEYARSRYNNIDFRCCDVSALDKSEMYDIIFAFELIEHVHSPKAFFQYVVEHLRPGGIFVLTTPNLDCGRKIGFERWAGFLFSYEHLYYFTPKILAEYGKYFNLSVLNCFTGGGSGIVKAPNSIRIILRKIFESTRILPYLKTVRDFMQSKQNNYTTQQEQHSIFMILSNKL